MVFTRLPLFQSNLILVLVRCVIYVEKERNCRGKKWGEIPVINTLLVLKEN